MYRFKKGLKGRAEMPYDMKNHEKRASESLETKGHFARNFNKYGVAISATFAAAGMLYGGYGIAIQSPVTPLAFSFGAVNSMIFAGWSGYNFFAEEYVEAFTETENEAEKALRTKKYGKMSEGSYVTPYSKKDTVTDLL